MSELSFRLTANKGVCASCRLDRLSFALLLFTCLAYVGHLRTCVPLYPCDCCMPLIFFKMHCSIFSRCNQKMHCLACGVHAMRLCALAFGLPANAILSSWTFYKRFSSWQILVYARNMHAHCPTMHVPTERESAILVLPILFFILILHIISICIY